MFRTVFRIGDFNMDPEFAAFAEKVLSAAGVEVVKTESAKTESAKSTPDLAESFELEVPGFGSEDIDISVEGKILTVSGKKGVRTFKRSYRLSSKVNTDAITAKVENGLLTLTLPSSEEAPKVRKVSIT